MGKAPITLTDQYLREMNDLLIDPAIIFFQKATAALLQGGFLIKLLTKIDMPLNK